MSDIRLFVGMDVHKTNVSIAVAEAGHKGEVRFVTNFDNDSETIIRQLKRHFERHGKLEFAYEAGPSAYTLRRRLRVAGFACLVAAPNKISTARGRVKNDDLDALALARLPRSGRARARLRSRPDA